MYSFVSISLIILDKNLLAILTSLVVMLST